MIGFKEAPTRMVLLSFLISIILILLLYVDISTDDSLPEELIEISEAYENQDGQVLTYQFHEVKNGENLSIIFEFHFQSLNLQ